MVSRVFKHLVEATLVVTAAAVGAHCGSGCKPASAAESEYVAELAACVQLAQDRWEADQCIAEVNARYKVCNSDAGLVPCP